MIFCRRLLREALHRCAENSNAISFSMRASSLAPGPREMEGRRRAAAAQNDVPRQKPRPPAAPRICTPNFDRPTLVDGAFDARQPAQARRLAFCPMMPLLVSILASIRMLHLNVTRATLSIIAGDIIFLHYYDGKRRVMPQRSCDGLSGRRRRAAQFSLSAFSGAECLISIASPRRATNAAGH